MTGKAKCLDEKCNRPGRTRGLCAFHYGQCQAAVRHGKATWDSLVAEGRALPADWWSKRRKESIAAGKERRRREKLAALVAKNRERYHVESSSVLSHEILEQAAELRGLSAEWAEVRARQVEMALKRLQFEVARSVIDDAEREAEELRTKQGDALATPLSCIFGDDARLLNRLETLGLLTVGDVLGVSLDWLARQRYVGEEIAASVAVRLERFLARRNHFNHNNGR